VGAGHIVRKIVPDRRACDWKGQAADSGQSDGWNQQTTGTRGAEGTTSG